MSPIHLFVFINVAQQIKWPTIIFKHQTHKSCICYENVYVY